MFFKVYGKNPSGKRLERIKASPNYKNNRFQNLSHTDRMAKDNSMLKTSLEFFNKSKRTEPSSILPFVKKDLNSIESKKPVIIWFGHSSYLIRINEKNILIDPVLSGSASPFSFMLKAFKGANEYSAADMPIIDLLILTHDHYDHLDYKTIISLNSKIKQIYCPLGLGSHLEYWGIKEHIITELDWWDKKVFDNDIEIIAAPTRHYTGRGLITSKVLWNSYILKTKVYNLYLGGDSGYDTHFKTIGEQYGPFDVSLLEAGQYNTAWPFIHMMPEETVQASIDLKSNKLFPIHWAKFALAFHDWDEPIKRVLKKAKELHVELMTPCIGESVIIDEPYVNKAWWEL